MSNVTRLRKEAMEEAAALPEADQEKIGRELLEHVEKLRALRDDPSCFPGCGR